MTGCSSWHRTLHVDGAPAPVRGLRTSLASFLTDANVPAQDVRAIVLAFSEALENAVEHGIVDAGELQMRMRFTPRFVLVSLRDSGSDRTPLGDPSAPDPDSDRGRGFQLMNQLMDYVKVRVYPTGGTRVTMMRRLDHPSS